MRTARMGSIAVFLAGMMILARPAAADRIDDFVRQRMEKNHIPGLALVVVRRGKVEKLRGYGKANLEWGIPATPDTRFQLASTTKPFTGLALMMLEAQGKLSLDDPVSRWIPNAPETWKPITVRHLAMHTSGLPDDVGEVHTAADVVAAAMKRPLAYAPGTQSQYGATDFVVLTQVMEQAAGKPYQQILRDAIFTPLGMSAAFDNATEGGPIRSSDLLERRAALYEWREGAQHNYDFLYTIPYYSAGGLYASAADFAQLARALDRGELLSAEARNRMWKPMSLPGGAASEFGAGWVVRRYEGRVVVGHSGGPALSDMVRFPDEGLTVVVLTNQHTLYPYLAESIADMLLPPRPEMSSGIEDSDTGLTSRLGRVLADAAQGRVDEEAFAPQARAQYGPMLKSMGPWVIGGMDPLTKMILRGERREGDRRIRRYRVLFGVKPMHWTFELDSEGRILAMRPGSE